MNDSNLNEYFSIYELHEMIDDCKKKSHITSTSNTYLRSFLYIKNAPPWEVLLWEHKKHYLWISFLFLCFPQSLLLRRLSYVMEYPIGQFGDLSHLCLLITSCPSSVFLLWKQNGEKALMLC